MDSPKSSSKEKDLNYAENEVQHGVVEENADNLKRSLNNRQIQLLAIGGSIGTALFVSIGTGLASGGPGSLFIAYVLYSCMMGLVNNCMAEMATLHPVSGGFIRMAGKWVDDAFGFMAGWNFFFYEALLIPFEITALNLVLGFWFPPQTVNRDAMTGAVCAICILLYGLINVLSVRAFGEAEFWLSGGKVLLIFLLFFYTLVTMCGGNPAGDAYGFRFWRDPGAFAEFRTDGDLGRFEGFLACLWSALFTIVGPEYIAMAAAEAQRPRHYIKTAFKTVYWRFGLFFILGALCVGIVVPWNDPVLREILAGRRSDDDASASPYVRSMIRLNIGGLPQLVNALMLTSIFSAGNTYTYCATRSLYSLALEGRAPRILAYTTKNGVPLFSFFVVMLFPLLSFLQLGDESSQVLDWLVALITAGGVINYFVMCVTFIHFYKACKVQGVDRTTFPYCGWFQPYSAYIGATCTFLGALFYGYSAFAPWSVETFFSSYTMQIVIPLLFIFWKILKRTKRVKPHEVDLVWERPFVDAYENSFTEPPTGFWTEMGGLIGIRKRKVHKEG